MSFGPLLGFAKYVSDMDLAFLTDYLERLSLLHPTYEGLLLPVPDNVEPRRGKDAAKELLCLLNKGRYIFKGYVCRHNVKARAQCDSFSWDITFHRFRIYGGAFPDVFGSSLNEDDSFVSAYGSEETFLASQGPHWIDQGLSDSISSFGRAMSQVSTAWDIYLSAKKMHHYEPHSKYYHSLLDYWGEYLPEKCARAGDFLETLRPLVMSYHPENFVNQMLDKDAQTDRLAFVRYADERIIRHLGRKQFSTMLSEFDLSLDQWLAAGEPRPANYSVGENWLPS